MYRDGQIRSGIQAEPGENAGVNPLRLTLLCGKAYRLTKLNFSDSLPFASKRFQKTNFPFEL